MQVGDHAFANVAAGCQDLSLFDEVTYLDAAAALFQMKVMSQRSIFMADNEPIVGTAQAMTVMADDDENDFAAAGRPDFGADRHRKIIGKAPRTPVTDDAPVALGTAIALADGPGQTIGRLIRRGILREVFGTGANPISGAGASQRQSKQHGERPPLRREKARYP